LERSRKAERFNVSKMTNTELQESPKTTKEASEKKKRTRTKYWGWGKTTLNGFGVKLQRKIIKSTLNGYKTRGVSAAEGVATENRKVGNPGGGGVRGRKGTGARRGPKSKRWGRESFWRPWKKEKGRGLFQKVGEGLATEGEQKQLGRNPQVDDIEMQVLGKAKANREGGELSVEKPSTRAAS